MTDIQADRATTAADPPPPGAPGSPVVAPTDTGALIDDILQRFHETHRRELPELLRLARRVETLHLGDPAPPVGLARLVERIQGELARHMVKEEVVVFPRMRRGGGAPLDRPLAALHAEHDDLASLLRALRTLTNDFACAKEVGSDRLELYAGLAKFADDLAEHVRLEDGLLFPRFEARRGPFDLHSISGE